MHVICTEVDFHPLCFHYFFSFSLQQNQFDFIWLFISTDLSTQFFRREIKILSITKNPYQTFLLKILVNIPKILPLLVSYRQQWWQRSHMFCLTSLCHSRRRLSVTSFMSCTFYIVVSILIVSIAYILIPVVLCSHHSFYIKVSELNPLEVLHATPLSCLCCSVLFFFLPAIFWTCCSFDFIRSKATAIGMQRWYVLRCLFSLALILPKLTFPLHSTLRRYCFLFVFVWCYNYSPSLQLFLGFLAAITFLAQQA